MMSPIARFSSGSQGRGFESRSGPFSDQDQDISHALGVFEASVKVVEDGCLHLPQEKNTTIQLESVYARLLAQLFNSMYLWIVILSLQKYNKKRELY